MIIRLKIFATFFIIISALLLSSCAFIPEKIKLEPNVGNIRASNIGHGKEVAVKVIDVRPTTSLGGRVSGYGPAADISLANDISTVVSDTVYKGLRKYGFKPVAYKITAPRKLTLRIIALQYKQKSGFLTASVNISSVIEADVINANKSYNHVYRGKRKMSVIVTPTSEEDAYNINQAFSSMLRKIVTDKKLMQFLAKKG